MEHKPLHRSVRLALVALTLFVAASLPLTYWFGWNDPEIALSLGVPSLRTLPLTTVVVAAAIILAQSALMIVIVLRLRRIVDSFSRGLFFSQEVVCLLRSVGRTLLVVALLRTIGLPIAILSVWMAGRQLQFKGMWLQVFNLPAATVLCGMFVLVVAGAFERAYRLAHDARFTV